MSKLPLIIRREFIAKVRNKSFIIMTFLSPVIFVSMGFLIYFLTKKNNEKTKKVLFVDESQLFNQEDFKNTKTLSFTNFSVFGIDMAKEKVEREEYYGVIFIPKEKDLEKLSNSIEFYANTTPGFSLTNKIENTIEKKLKNKKLEDLGFDIEKINKSKVDANIKIFNFSGEESSRLSNGLKIGFGAVAGYLLMMFVMIYGTSVMRSVIEEKTSRIIEVIVSSVKPFQLMLGKIIGNASAGLLQFFIWGFLLFVILSISSAILGVDVVEMQTARLPQEQVDMAKNVANQNEMQLLFQEVLRLPILKIFVLFIFYFFGGFMLYSSLFASIGAAVDSETDTQQFMLPVMLPLILGVYIGLATVIDNPNGPVATVFSHIPFTSPIVMLMRVPFGVSWVEIIISMLILIVTFSFMVWLAAKIYRVGILMYGKKASYKDLYKWLKYKG